MTIYHKHHIIPKHAGGTDDPSNIVLLTIEEHATAHENLWKEHGRWQDYCAWKSLTNQITNSERNYLLSVNRDTTYMQTEEYKKVISESCKGRKPTSGCFKKGNKRSSISIDKQRKTITGRKRGPYKSSNESRKIKVNLYGKEYPSIDAARKDTGYSFYTIKRLMQIQLLTQEH